MIHKIQWIKTDNEGWAPLQLSVYDYNYDNVDQWGLLHQLS